MELSECSVLQSGRLNKQEEEELVGHRMASGLTHALRALHHTWDEVGLNEEEQKREWEGFVHNALEPLLQHWVRSHQRTESLIVQANDVLFQKLVWLVFELQEQPESKSLASLLSVIQRDCMQGQHGDGGNATLETPNADGIEESDDDEEDELFQLLPFQLGCGALHLPPQENKIPTNEENARGQNNNKNNTRHAAPERDHCERRRRTYWRRIKRWLPFVRHLSSSSSESSRWNSGRSSSCPVPCLEENPPTSESQSQMPSRKRTRDENDTDVEPHPTSDTQHALKDALHKLTESATHRDIFSILIKEVRRLCHLLYCRRLVLEILVQQKAMLTSPSSPFSVKNKMETYCTTLALHQLTALHHTVSSRSEQLFPTGVLLSTWFSSDDKKSSMTNGWQGEEIPLPPTNLTSIVAFMNGGNSNDGSRFSTETSMKSSHCFASCRESVIPQPPREEDGQEEETKKGAGIPAGTIATPMQDDDEDEWGLFMKTSFYRENTDDALNRCSWQPLHLPTPRRTIAAKGEQEKAEQSHTCLPFPPLTYTSLCLPAEIEQLLMDATKTLPCLQFNSFRHREQPCSGLPESCLPLHGETLDSPYPSALTWASLSREIDLLTLEMTRELPLVVTEASQYKALLALLEKEWVETTALVEEQEVSDPEVVPSPHKKCSNLSMTDMASKMMVKMDALLHRFQSEWKQWEKKDYSFLKIPFGSMSGALGSPDDKPSSWWTEVFQQRCEIATLADVANGLPNSGEHDKTSRVCEEDFVSSNLCCYASLLHLLIGYSCLTPPLRRFARETCAVLSKHMIQKYEAVLQRLALKLAEAYKEYYDCTGDKRYANPPELELKLIGRCDGFSESVSKECGPGSLSSTRSPEAVAEFLFAPLRRWIREAQDEIDGMSKERQALRRRLDILREARSLLQQRQTILEDHQRLLCDKELKGDRLLNKKVNMANQLLQEEQARRRVARELPQLMKKLSRLVAEWKTLVSPGVSEAGMKGGVVNPPETVDLTSPGGESPMVPLHHSLTVDGVMVENILANHQADLMAHGISAADRAVHRSRAGLGQSMTPPPSRTPTPPISVQTPSKVRSVSRNDATQGETPSRAIPLHSCRSLSTSPGVRRPGRTALSPPPSLPGSQPVPTATTMNGAPLLRPRNGINQSSSVVKPSYRKRTRESPPPSSRSDNKTPSNQ